MFCQSLDQVNWTKAISWLRELCSNSERISKFSRLNDFLLFHVVCVVISEMRKSINIIIIRLFVFLFHVRTNDLFEGDWGSRLEHLGRKLNFHFTLCWSFLSFCNSCRVRSRLLCVYFLTNNFELDILINDCRFLGFERKLKSSLSPTCLPQKMKFSDVSFTCFCVYLHFSFVGSIQWIENLIFIP